MRAANKGKAQEKRKRMEAIWREIDEPPAELKEEASK
jgi:COX assembly protein 2